MPMRASNENLISVSASTGQSFTRASGPVLVSASSRPSRRRRLTPDAGRAIEMLGHAIEYLADEFTLECMTTRRPVAAGTHPQMKAIELLMARNREIYFSCPELPTFGERLRSWLHLQRA